jgi:hypothetical protein
MFRTVRLRKAKVKYALLGWLIGLPLPIVLLLLFSADAIFDAELVLA